MPKDVIEKIKGSMDNLQANSIVNYNNGLITKEEKSYMDGKVAGLQQALNYIYEEQR
jgi:hypothetical protein